MTDAPLFRPGWRPYLILGAALVILIIYAYPGQMTRDSFDHLIEAREGVYTDGHPPAIDAIWRKVDWAIAGPFGMLLLQSVTFLAGLFVVLRRILTPVRAAWLASALFLFPPVMLPFAVIWKDCLMAGCLMLAIAGMSSEHRAARLWALVAVFVATAVRYNAIGATLPIVILLFQWTPGWPWIKRYALATTAWLGVTFAAFGANSAITDAQMHIWHSSLAVFDIVGTLAYVDEDLPDSELAATLAGTDVRVTSNYHAHMRRLYDPRDFLPIVNDETQPLWRLPIRGTMPAPQSTRDAITRTWKDVITSHPGAYLKHRLAVLAEVLSLTQARPPGVVIPRDLPEPFPATARALGLPTGSSVVQYKAATVMRWIWRTIPIFSPWIYLVIALVLLSLTRRQRDVFVILLSGIMLEATLLFLAASPDYRYSHWMIVSTCVAAVILTARRIRIGDATPR